MSYQSLYRRFRPRRFAEVRGQQHLVSALRNAVREDRVGHAYLLSGPRGTGKTSTARILAKVLNCENPVDGEPCCECPSCLAIEAGTSFDVHELDAASNNGVEAVRELIAKASLGTPGRTKVYILDEVHMLSSAASNALLKTLEEPPEHVVFVLATTDPQKVLPTIRSRTQHFEVHLLPAADLEALVDDVVAEAALDVDQAGKAYVLRAGAGSARDTLSALDRVVAAGGVPDEADALDELVEALCDRDTARALVAVDAALARGRSPRVLGESLIARLRDVFLAAVRADLSRLTEADQQRCRDHAERLGAAGATRALEVLGDAFVGIQDALDPRIPLEVALVRLTRADADTSPAALAERLSRLERAVAEGGSAAPPAGPRPPAPSPRGTERAPARADEPVATSAPAAPPTAAGDEGPGEAPGGPPVEAGERPAGGGRPGDVAREQLARARGAEGAPARPPTASDAPPAERPAPPPPRRPGPPSGRSPGAPAAAPPSRPPAQEPPTAASTTASTTASTPAPTTAAPAAGGPLPDRDMLTIAWGDTVLGSLPQKAKVRFAGGRWVAVDDGVAVFGLPNAVHAQRCEECRADVETALGAHFGTTVPVRLVVDEHAEAPPTPGAPPARPRAEAPDTEADDDDIDVNQLADADDVADSGLDRVTSVFPGAELVDDGTDRLL